MGRPIGSCPTGDPQPACRLRSSVSCSHLSAGINRIGRWPPVWFHVNQSAGSKARVARQAATWFRQPTLDGRPRLPPPPPLARRHGAEPPDDPGLHLRLCDGPSKGLCMGGPGRPQVAGRAQLTADVTGRVSRRLVGQVGDDQPGARPGSQQGALCPAGLRRPSIVDHIAFVAPAPPALLRATPLPVQRRRLWCTTPSLLPGRARTRFPTLVAPPLICGCGWVDRSGCVVARGARCRPSASTAGRGRRHGSDGELSASRRSLALQTHLQTCHASTGAASASDRLASGSGSAKLSPPSIHR